jgi:cation diffusion facilitator family transporter
VSAHGGQHTESRRTVLIALVANAAIMVVKAIGGVVSGSSALLAEAAHSVADTANQGFLLASLGRSVKEPDDEHPFGYGQERFLWAFVAAIGIFVAGACFSAYQGLEAILGAGGESEFWIAYAILAFAFVAEGISWLRAVKQTRGEAAAGGLSLSGHLRKSRDPTTKTVLFEDSAAVAGTVVAFAGVALHQATGHAYWEGIAALVVAAMLVLAATVLGRGASSLLVGQAASHDERAQIIGILEARPEVEEVMQLLTMALSPERLLVAVRVDFTPGLDSERIEDASYEIDRELRDRVPGVAEVFLDATDKHRWRRADLPSLGVVKGSPTT